MSVPSITRFRRCVSCQCTKPLTVAFFHYRGDTKNWRNRCKACTAEQKRLHRKKNPGKIAEQKRQSYLKNRETVRAKQKEYYDENREDLVEYRRSYYKKNRELCLEAARLRRERFPEKIADSKRASYLRNPEQKKAATRKWYEQNKEKALHSSRKWKALKKGAEHEPYGPAEINEMWYQQGGSCAYCRMPLFAYYHVDHILPLSRGGADKLSNLALSCPTCNMRKHAKTGDEFREVLRREEQRKQDTQNVG